jgi:hypothetical protein
MPYIGAKPFDSIGKNCPRYPTFVSPVPASRVAKEARHHIKRISRATRTYMRAQWILMARIPWNANFPPADMNDRCLAAFRTEHHHAD